MATFQLVLEPSLLDRAKAAAKKEGISLAAFIRQLISKRLDEMAK